MDEVEKVVVGQRHLVERLIIAMLADGHVLLEGVPGLAKTLLVRTLSQALDLDSRIGVSKPPPARPRRHSGRECMGSSGALRRRFRSVGHAGQRRDGRRSLLSGPQGWPRQFVTTLIRLPSGGFGCLIT
jgi:hypothetical protein